MNKYIRSKKETHMNTYDQKTLLLSASYFTYCKVQTTQQVIVNCQNELEFCSIVNDFPIINQVSPHHDYGFFTRISAFYLVQPGRSFGTIFNLVLEFLFYCKVHELLNAIKLLIRSYFTMTHFPEKGD